MLIIVLREVNADDLWGMWAVVVKSRCFGIGICFRKVEGWGEVGDLRRPFEWVINFFIKLQKTGGIVNAKPMMQRTHDGAPTRSSRSWAFKYGGRNSH